MRFIAVLWADDYAKKKAHRIKEAFSNKFPGAKARSNRSTLVSYYPGQESCCFASETAEKVTLSPYRHYPTNSSKEALPPYAVVTVQDDCIEVTQDYIGSSRVFIHESANLIVVANAINCAASVIGRSLDWMAIRDFASCGWVMADRTFNENFRQARPNERSAFRRFENCVTTRTHNETAPILIQDEKSALASMKSSLVDLVDSLPKTREPTIVSLSGGRDSRLVAAVFLAANRDVQFNTIDNFSDETELAKTLMRLVGRSASHEIASPRKGPAEAYDAITSARALVRTYDGLYEPTYIGLVNGETLKDPLTSAAPLNISGAGGEMAHGHYWPKSDAPLTITKQQAIDHLLQRRLAGIKLSTPSVREDFNAAVERWLRAAPATFDGVRILDYFYLYERQRRWSSASARNNIVAPFLHPSFALGALSFGPKNILDNTIHSILIESLVPQWKGIPYFKAPPKMTSNRPVMDRTDAKFALDMVSSYEPLRNMIDCDRLSSVLEKWDELAPPMRDGAVKRAMWLACVAEEFDQNNRYSASEFALDALP